MKKGASRENEVLSIVRVVQHAYEFQPINCSVRIVSVALVLNSGRDTLRSIGGRVRVGDHDGAGHGQGARAADRV